MANGFLRLGQMREGGLQRFDVQRFDFRGQGEYTTLGGQKVAVNSGSIRIMGWVLVREKIELRRKRRQF